MSKLTFARLLPQELIREMALLLGLFKFCRIVLLGAAPWDRQRRPFRILHHFTDEHDLPNMVRVMRQLPIDGLKDRMPLVADIDDGAPVFFVDLIQSMEKAGPAFVPFGYECFPCDSIILELGLPLPPFLLPVRGEEVRPTAQHIAPKVLDNGSNAVAFGIVLPKQLFVGELGKGLFAQ